MINIKENISLKEYTTFNIGGNARYFVEVGSIDDIIEAIAYAKKKNLQYFVLAGGSNVLFSDDGFDGLVIKIAMDSIAVNDSELKCGAGAVFLDVLTFAAKNGLAGGAHLAGIPGSVGGAVRGNAGAFGTEIKDFVKEVHVFNIETEKIEIFDNTKCAFVYRNSFFKKNPKYIIISVTFNLEKGDKKEIEIIMNDIIAKRNKKQVQDIKSAGSFFVNPTVDESVQKLFEQDTGKKSRNGRVPAGWLLDECELFQKRIGDIQAGIEHANYFINMGDATAQQVIQLAAVAKARVRNEFDVQLKEEIVLAGF